MVCVIKNKKKVHKSPWYSEIPASQIHLRENPCSTTQNLSGEGELLALEHLGYVQVEEVAVEDGLNDAGNDGDEVEEALRVVAVNPVEQVQAAVQAESEQVVSGDGLSLAWRKIWTLKNVLKLFIKCIKICV